MVKVKKETISREAFEREMDEILKLVGAYTEPKSLVINMPVEHLQKAIHDAKVRLTEYIDERDAEKFRIPEWLNQDVTVTVQAKEIK